MDDFVRGGKPGVLYNLAECGLRQALSRLARPKPLAKAGGVA